MVVRQAVRYLDPETVVYIGNGPDVYKRASGGGGYYYIGYAKDVPVDEYGDYRVVEAYDRFCDYPGKILLTDSPQRGRAYFWHEIDPSVPMNEKPMTDDLRPYKDLVIQMAKEELNGYRKSLKAAIEHRDPKTTGALEETIRRCRRESQNMLTFVSGTNIGDYLISAIEDEARTYWKNPKIRKISDSDKKYAILKKNRRELQAERVKKEAKSKYATIKGKSINHELQ